MTHWQLLKSSSNNEPKCSKDEKYVPLNSVICKSDDVLDVKAHGAHGKSEWECMARVSESVCQKWVRVYGKSEWERMARVSECADQ